MRLVAYVTTAVAVTGSVEVANDTGSPIPVAGTVDVGSAVTVTGSVEVANDTGSPIPVAGTVTVPDSRSLVERMLARAPSLGYHLWLDVLASSSSYIYVCEAPDAATTTSAVWRGIRLALDSTSGNPLGGVATASDFAWDDRAAATWET